jgi:hypothetical protein
VDGVDRAQRHRAKEVALADGRQVDLHWFPLALRSNFSSTTNSLAYALAWRYPKMGKILAPPP